MEKKYIKIMALALLMPGLLNARSKECCDTSAESCCKIIKTVPCDPCDCVVSSRTHFSTRPLFQVGSPEREALFRDAMNAKEGGRGGAFQAVVFGGKSTDRGTLATYFTPFCKSELRVREYDDGGDNSGLDVFSNHFNIVTPQEDGPFESIIRFAPQQSTLGFGLHYRQRFGCKDDGRAYWFEVSSPITRVKNSLGFSEEVINAAGGAASDKYAATMTDAFKQKLWGCGKIDCNCESSETRLADITLLLGREVVQNDCCQLSSYIGALIPTGNNVDTEYLFGSVVGHNKHAGFMFGSTGRVHLWENECNNQSLALEFQVHGLFLGQKTQRRLIDLQNKPWSRFMRVYKDKEQAEEAFALLNITGSEQECQNSLLDAQALHEAGVNVFCQCVKVKPGFQRNYNTTFVYNRNCYTAELGYNFFCRPAECVELECPWKEGPALAALVGAGMTTRSHTINDVFNELDGVNPCYDFDPLDQYEDNMITECDLDLRSAAHPCMVTHTIHGSLGYNWENCCRPVFAGLGGSYEMSPDNAGMNRWNVWGKMGLSW